MTGGGESRYRYIERDMKIDREREKREIKREREIQEKMR